MCGLLFIVQDASGEFVTQDCDGIFMLQPNLRNAFQFNDRQEAHLCAFENCESGFYVFTFCKGEGYEIGI